MKWFNSLPSVVKLRILKTIELHCSRYHRGSTCFFKVLFHLLRRYRTTEYTECQAFFTVVRIGSPEPLTSKGVLRSPPFGSKGGDTLACGGGGGGTLLTTGQTRLCIL
jgi:hypothetical protein